MKNEVRYIDGGGQRAHELYTRGVPQQPDEQVMFAEDGARDERACCLGELVDFMLADGRPNDWVWVLRRLAAVVRYFFPQAAADLRRAAPECVWRGGGAGWGLGEMVALRDEPETVRALVLWLLGGSAVRLNRKLVRDGCVRLYFLALGVRPESLRREGGGVMTLEDLAEAFGESREGARQRWSYRGVQMMAGLPKMGWQRSEAVREEARVRTTATWRRRKGKGNGKGRRGGKGGAGGGGE